MGKAEAQRGQRSPYLDKRDKQNKNKTCNFLIPLGLNHCRWGLNAPNLQMRMTSFIKWFAICGQPPKSATGKIFSHFHMLRSCDHVISHHSTPLALQASLEKRFVSPPLDGGALALAPGGWRVQVPLGPLYRSHRSQSPFSG